MIGAIVVLYFLGGSMTWRWIHGPHSNAAKLLAVAVWPVVSAIEVIGDGVDWLGSGP